MRSNFEQTAGLAKEAEFFETPQWAAERVLDHELLTQEVIDPCCGRGVLSRAALGKGYDVRATDLHDWGYGESGIDFLEGPYPYSLVGRTVFMNPPFSKAEKFIEYSLFECARKVVCFQRFAWYESRKRRAFWQEYPPNRVYICGDRATCWRGDIPEGERTSSTPTAHAWFVWEKGHPPGTVMGAIYK